MTRLDLIVSFMLMRGFAIGQFEYSNVEIESKYPQVN